MGQVFNVPTTVAIANGTSLSNGITLGSGVLVGIQMPSTWTTANLTFQASVDGVTYVELFDGAGNEVTVTAAASEMLAVTSSLFAPCIFLKVRSGTSGSAVNQGQNVLLTLVTRKVALR